MNKKVILLSVFVVFSFLAKSWAQESSQVHALKVATRYFKEGDTIGQCKINSIAPLGHVVRVGAKTYPTLAISFTSLVTKELITLNLLWAGILNIDTGSGMEVENSFELKKLGSSVHMVVDRAEKIQGLVFMKIEKTAPHFSITCL